MKHLSFSAIVLSLVIPTGAHADWPQNQNEAKGQTVYFNAWGGGEAINNYIAWAVKEVKTRLGTLPTFAQLIWHWLTDPDPALQARGSAASVILSFVLLISALAVRGFWQLMHWHLPYPTGWRKPASSWRGLNLLTPLFLTGYAVVAILIAVLRLQFRKFVFDQIERQHIPTLQVTHDPADVPYEGRVIEISAWQPHHV